jgi:hypothetical protein
MNYGVDDSVNKSRITNVILTIGKVHHAPAATQSGHGKEPRSSLWLLSWPFFAKTEPDGRKAPKTCLMSQGYTSILARGLPIVRYSFCALLAAIAWCAATSNLLYYAWFLSHEWQRSNTRLPPYTIDLGWLFSLPNSGGFGSLLPTFLSATVAVIAWHLRKKRS